MHTKYKSWALKTALAASALAMVSGPSFAQDTTQYSSEITIVGPHTHHRVLGRTSAGIPIEEVALTQYVSYADLDLRQPSNIAELNRRVAGAAWQSCQQLEDQSLGNPMLDTDRYCADYAVGEAQAQIDSAVAIANR